MQITTIPNVIDCNQQNHLPWHSCLFSHAPFFQSKRIYLTNPYQEGMLKSKGYPSIWVEVYMLSKFGRYIPLKHLYEAIEVSSVFTDLR